MAVQNHIYIYIGKNGAPTILNVDNAADGTALEQLGALKMPEAMAAEIFGENIQYADKTTCIITNNPDNAEFPYNVVFDSSKIPSKPKRNTGTMADIGMPGEMFINITPQLVDAQYKRYKGEYTAPANGYFASKGRYSSITPVAAMVALESLGTNRVIQYANNVITNSVNKADMYVIIPIKKGNICVYTSAGQEFLDFFRFIYAEGEL